MTRRLYIAGAGVAVLLILALAVGISVGRLTATRTVSTNLAPSPTSSASAATPVAKPAGTPAAGFANCRPGELVTTSDELNQALAAAAPGVVIDLAPGSYTGQFVAKASGTQQAPITLCGGRDAVLDGGTTKAGYTLYLNSVDWWKVIGFSIQGGQKGVVTDHAHHVLIQGLFVHDIGDEGIHLREFSTDNVVDGNKVRNTGLLNTKFGEGIYVGTAHSNWCKYTACAPDNSDRNVITNNDIANTAAENIDIKEGTSGGIITGNHLSGDGMVASAASAWINLKGNGWTVTGNSGVHSIKDGFQVHRVYAGWGESNVFHANQAEVDGPGYGYYVQSSSLATVFTCDNTAVGAQMGLSNIHCR